MSQDVIDLTADDDSDGEPNMRPRKLKPYKFKPLPQTEDYGDLTCKVCLTNKINMITYPCSHACMCDECFRALPVPKQCPICRKYITRVVFVIFPT